MTGSERDPAAGGDDPGGGARRTVLTLPNGISLLRLLLVPVFWVVLLGEGRVGLAAALIVLTGSTDWVDGYLARRLDQVTELGKLLDPIADRLMIGSAVLGGMLAAVVPPVVAIPLLVREALVGVGAIALMLRGGAAPAVRSLGKLATFLLYGSIPAFYLAGGEILPWLFAPVAWAGAVVGLVLYYRVALDYLGDVRDGFRSSGPPS